MNVGISNSVTTKLFRGSVTTKVKVPRPHSHRGTTRSVTKYNVVSTSVSKLPNAMTRRLRQRRGSKIRLFVYIIVSNNG